MAVPMNAEHNEVSDILQFFLTKVIISFQGPMIQYISNTPVPLYHLKILPNSFIDSSPQVNKAHYLSILVSNFQQVFHVVP